MDFILNERSLHGQFRSVDEFLKSLGANLQCFKLVRSQKQGEIRKIADFYKCKITEELGLGELRHYPRSDELSRFRIALDKEMRTEPYWDLEPVHDYGISYWMGEEDMAATAVMGMNITLFPYIVRHIWQNALANRWVWNGTNV